MLQTIFFLLAIMLFSLKAEGKAAEQSSEEGKLHVLVKRLHGFRDSPLHSELIINGETVDILSMDTCVNIDHFKIKG